MLPIHDSSRRSVLIVDESKDSREVLKAVLEHRGLTILEASEAKSGLELARTHQPGVIVLDLEAESAGDSELQKSYNDHGDSDASLVVLGTLKMAGDRFGREQLVSKPYHFAPLIRKIEELLDQPGGQEPDAAHNSNRLDGEPRLPV